MSSPILNKPVLAISLGALMLGAISPAYSAEQASNTEQQAPQKGRSGPVELPDIGPLSPLPPAADDKFLSSVLIKGAQDFFTTAYMYCVTENNQWKWAYWDGGTDGGKKIAQPNWLLEQRLGHEWKRGVLLRGTLLYNESNKPTLRMFQLKKPFAGDITENYSDVNSLWIGKPGQAVDYCRGLIAICTGQYGPDYKYIGAGRGSVLGWNAISMYQPREGRAEGELYTCPSWSDKEIADARLNFSESFSHHYSYQVSCKKGGFQTTFRLAQKPSSEYVWINGQLPQYLQTRTWSDQPGNGIYAFPARASVRSQTQQIDGKVSVKIIVDLKQSESDLNAEVGSRYCARQNYLP